MKGAAVLAALLAAAACGGEEEKAPPPPNPVATPTSPVIPVAGRRVPFQQLPPVNFEWPGGVTVSAPEPGTVTVLYTLDNPCRHVPSGALASQRGDTVALVVSWPRVQPDSSMKCPAETTPFAYSFKLEDVPPGTHVFGMFEAIEGQTAAALSHTTEVTVP